MVIELTQAKLRKLEIIFIFKGPVTGVTEAGRSKSLKFNTFARDFYSFNFFTIRLKCEDAIYLSEM